MEESLISAIAVAVAEALIIIILHALRLCAHTHLQYLLQTCLRADPLHRSPITLTLLPPVTSCSNVQRNPLHGHGDCVLRAQLLFSPGYARKACLPTGTASHIDHR